MRAPFGVFFLLFFSTFLPAQHQDVFPGLSGEELLDSLVARYKPIPLNQANARDTLFAKIYSVNDSLTCVYSGSTIYLNPNLDPTQAAFESPAEINTEHTYPKSLGAEGIGEGDMHHLYATRSDVNNDRGNLPFGEIPDGQTETWYYLGQQSGSIPTSNIPLYSEGTDSFFEPPEAHKGNVARAMMYFYTMYEPQANAADPIYFEQQRQTLCAWHHLDPVDQAEWSRTWGIAGYQQGKPNPFVLDCTLPERSYCQEFGQGCTPVATLEVAGHAVFSLRKIQPNPVQNGALIEYELGSGGNVRLEVFNLQGQKMDTVEIGHQGEGVQSFFYERGAGIVQGCFGCCFRRKSKHFQLLKKCPFYLKKSRPTPNSRIGRP